MHEHQIRDGISEILEQGFTLTRLLILRRQRVEKQIYCPAELTEFIWQTAPGNALAERRSFGRFDNILMQHDDLTGIAAFTAPEPPTGNGKAHTGQCQ